MEKLEMYRNSAHRVEAYANPNFKPSDPWEDVRQVVVRDLHENPLSTGETREYPFGNVVALRYMGYSKPGPQGGLDNHDHICNAADVMMKYFETE